VRYRLRAESEEHLKMCPSELSDKFSSVTLQEQMEVLKYIHHFRNTFGTWSLQPVNNRARGRGRDWKMAEQGDQAVSLRGGKVNPSFGRFGAFTLVSKREVGKKAASYITSESSYLILGNKLGGRWQLFWSLVSQLAKLRYSSYWSALAHLARCACEENSFTAHPILQHCHLQLLL
jgi:hypothetical protein